MARVPGARVVDCLRRHEVDRGLDGSRIAILGRRFADLHGEWGGVRHNRIHVVYQESVRCEVTIDDDLSVPVAARGLVWQGINVFAFETDFDTTIAQEQARSVQNAFEGPFRSIT
jgi:hypothetical protein